MEERKLCEICNINMGQSPDSSSYNESGNGLAFYQGNADFGEISPNTRIWCNKPIKIAEKGDILISVRAPIGAMNIAAEKCCIGRGLAAIRPLNATICDPDYLYHFLESRIPYLQSKGTGSTFKAISKGTLTNLEIRLPEIQEQQRISLKIVKIKQQISLKKRELEKFDDLVKSQFSELFGGKEFEEMTWRDVVKIVNGKDHKAISAEEGTYPIYGSGGYMNLRCEQFLCNEDSVIIGRKGNISKPLFVKEKFWNVDTAFGIEADRSVMNPYYFYYNCNNYNFEHMNTGTTIPSLTKSQLLELRIKVPPIELQNQFANFVKHIDKLKFREKYTIQAFLCYNKFIIKEKTQGKRGENVKF